MTLSKHPQQTEAWLTMVKTLIRQMRREQLHPNAAEQRTSVNASNNLRTVSECMRSKARKQQTLTSGTSSNHLNNHLTNHHNNPVDDTTPLTNPAHINTHLLFCSTNCEEFSLTSSPCMRFQSQLLFLFLLTPH